MGSVLISEGSLAAMSLTLDISRLCCVATILSSRTRVLGMVRFDFFSNCWVENGIDT